MNIFIFYQAIFFIWIKEHNYSIWLTLACKDNLQLRIFEIKSCRSCGTVYRRRAFQVWKFEFWRNLDDVRLSVTMKSIHRCGKNNPGNGNLNKPSRKNDNSWLRIDGIHGYNALSVHCKGFFLHILAVLVRNNIDFYYIKIMKIYIVSRHCWRFMKAWYV